MQVLRFGFSLGKPNPTVDYFKVVSANAAAVPEDQQAWADLS